MDAVERPNVPQIIERLVELRRQMADHYAQCQASPSLAVVELAEETEQLVLRLRDWLANAPVGSGSAHRF